MRPGIGRVAVTLQGKLPADGSYLSTVYMALQAAAKPGHNTILPLTFPTSSIAG